MSGPIFAPVDPLGRAFAEAGARAEALGKAPGSSLSPARRAQIREIAEDFESVFLGRMLAPMFESLESDELFGGGSGERMYRELLVEEYGNAIARSGGVGIADAVYRQIIASQEV